MVMFVLLVYIIDSLVGWIEEENLWEESNGENLFAQAKYNQSDKGIKKLKEASKLMALMRAGPLHRDRIARPL